MDYSNNYIISDDFLNQINKLENSIINRKPLTIKLFNYLKNITLGKIQLDFWYLLSIHWFWLLVLFIMIPQTYKN